MATISWWVFESRTHKLLRSGRTIQLFPIRPLRHVNVIYRDHTASHQRQISTCLMLPPSPDCLFREGVQLTPGSYYRPPKDNFPATDSLFFIELPGEPSPILLMFQITRNCNEIDANSLGLDTVDGLVPSNTRKWYVVVTPVGIEASIKVAKTYFSSRGVDVKNVERATLCFVFSTALIRQRRCFCTNQSWSLVYCSLTYAL